MKTLLRIIGFAALLLTFIEGFRFNHIKPRQCYSRFLSSPNEGVIAPKDIKSRLAADMKDAMRSKQKERLSAIRAIQTAIKQKEVDDRVVVG